MIPEHRKPQRHFHFHFISFSINTLHNKQTHAALPLVSIAARLLRSAPSTGVSRPVAVVIIFLNFRNVSNSSPPPLVRQPPRTERNKKDPTRQHNTHISLHNKRHSPRNTPLQLHRRISCKVRRSNPNRDQKLSHTTQETTLTCRRNFQRVYTVNCRIIRIECNS